MKKNIKKLSAGHTLFVIGLFACVLGFKTQTVYASTESKTISYSYNSEYKEDTEVFAVGDTINVNFVNGSSYQITGSIRVFNANDELQTLYWNEDGTDTIRLYPVENHGANSDDDGVEVFGTNYYFVLDVGKSLESEIPNQTSWVNVKHNKNSWSLPDGWYAKYCVRPSDSSVAGTTWNYCMIYKFSNNTDDNTSESNETATYEYIDNTGNQTYTTGTDETASFRINADYSLFENGGKVYVDDELVDSSNYTSKSGSTIITFTKAFMSSLSTGSHTLKVVFNNNGTATTNFSITNASNNTDTTLTDDTSTSTEATTKETISNPQTSDNIMFYISMLGLSIIGLAGAGLYLKKDLINIKQD